MSAPWERAPRLQSAYNDSRQAAAATRMSVLYPFASSELITTAGRPQLQPYHGRNSSYNCGLWELVQEQQGVDKRAAAAIPVIIAAFGNLNCTLMYNRADLSSDPCTCTSKSFQLLPYLSCPVCLSDQAASVDQSTPPSQIP